MKSASPADFTRELPSLAITTAVSAGCIIVFALIHSRIVSEEQRPQPVTAMSVAQKSALVGKPPVDSSRKQESTPEKKTPPANKPATETKSALDPKPTEVVKPEATRAKTSGTKTLVQARADYQREKTQFLQAISADLAKREAAAQDAGDAELIKQIKAMREDYAQGMIPKDAPGKDLIELMAARETVATLLQRELQSAQEKSSLEKSDASQVATLKKELADFMMQESADIGDVNWRFPECTFRLINVATGLALAAHDEGNGAAVIQSEENPDDPLQQWFVRFPGQWYSRVRLRKNGRNLNVPASDRAAGRAIIMWHEEHQANGYWELQYRGTYYHVRSHFSGQLLSVPDAKKTAGQQLIQWPHHDDPEDQRWKLIRVLPELAASGGGS